MDNKEEELLTITELSHDNQIKNLMQEINDEEHIISEKKEANKKDTISSIKEEINKEIIQNNSPDKRFKYLQDLASKYEKGDKKYAVEIAYCSLSSLYDWEKL